MRFLRIAFALAAPLLLASCLLTPGRFTSSLDIKRDRSFTFTYVGEVVLTDPSDQIGRGLSDKESEEDEEAEEEAPAEPSEPKPETRETIVKRRAIAEAMMKEAGYRSAEYLGNGKFRVDYAMSGRLDRNFIYPFNSDATQVIPWIAIEVRKDGTVRVKAPAFGDEPDMGLGGPGRSLQDAAVDREGAFTLTTDAELVMHNNEEGMAASTDPARKTVVWRVTPTSKTVPTAVVRF